MMILGLKNYCNAVNRTVCLYPFFNNVAKEVLESWKVCDLNLNNYKK